MACQKFQIVNKNNIYMTSERNSNKNCTLLVKIIIVLFYKEQFKCISRERAAVYEYSDVAISDLTPYARIAN